MAGTIAALGAVAVALALVASPALAVKIHPFEKEVQLPLPPKGLGAPSSVAIDQSTHSIYVSQGREIVRKFTATGALDPVHPNLTGTTNVEPLDLAVDNSGGPANGFVYTTDPANGVQQYDADGEATTVHITAASLPANGTPQGGGLPPVVNDGAFRPNWIAVDSTGNVVVSDNAHPLLLDQFTPSGAFVAQLPYGEKVDRETNDPFSIGPGDTFYIIADGGIYRIGSTGTCIDGEVEEDCSPFISVPLPGRFNSVNVDGSGHVLLTRRDSASSVPLTLVEYDSAGDPFSTVGQEQLIEPRPGAVRDEASDQIYAVDRQLAGGGGVSTGRLLIFGPTVILPDATALPPTEVTDRGAFFHGEIGADSGIPATCVFQYVDEAEFEASKFADAAEVPCEPGGPFTSEAPTPVEAQVEGLRGGTTYRVRLLATNENGSNPSTAVTFQTEGPTISGSRANEVGADAATLRASINPNGSATSYRFEYLTLGAFEANPPSDRFAGAQQAPIGGAGIGAGETPVAVAQRITGLPPGTAYRFRVVASGVGGAHPGESVGPAAGFATLLPPPVFGPCPNEARRGGLSKFLPDCRAYEQASPVGKNGASIQGEPNAVQAALDGSAITFYSGLGIPGGEGAQNLPSYRASRAADGSGWLTRGLLPPAATGPFGVILGWSPDLRNVYTANRLLGSPETFYRREGDAPIQALAAGEGSALDQFSFAAQSSSGDAVLFENDTTPLAPGAIGGKTNPYIWDKASGTLHLAGVLNDGSAPSEGSFAGSYDWFNSHDTTVGSASGSYYLQDAHAISADGSRAFFTAAGSGRLYMRENPTAPQSPLDGEGNCTNPALACTVLVSESERTVPDTEQPAAFLAATPDGSRVFFLSREKLTDDATGGPEGTGGDLYRYDVGAGLEDLTPDAGDEKGADVQGILGMSRDGSYVYFAANGVLAPGAQPGNCRIGLLAGECSVYLAHAGTVQLIARLRPQALSESDVLNWAPTSFSLSGNSTEENTARVSPDGSTLLIRSRARLTAYDNEGRPELYRFRLGGGMLCISCNPSGEAPTGDASLQSLPFRLLGPRLAFPVKTRNLSADGNRIFFDTPDRLVAADNNSVIDVYEWEAANTGSCQGSLQNGGCLYLLSSGSPDAEPSQFGDADESGDNAFFFTAAQLVPQDKDELVDVYDARVGGGIAAQETQPSAPCLTEGECLGAAGGAPTLSTPKSPGTNGANVAPPKSCKKGQVRRKGKCAKKKHKKKRAHHKAKKKQKGKKGSAKSKKGKKGSAKNKKSGKGGNR